MAVVSIEIHPWLAVRKRLCARWPARCAAAALAYGLAAAPAGAILPYGLPNPADPYDYASYLYINSGDCSQGDRSKNDLPPNFDCVNSWKFTDYQDPNPTLANSAQNLYGVEGTGLNRAWEVSTGRPDVVIAVLDSGVEWTSPGAVKALANKWYLNRGELPKPVCADGRTGNPEDRRFGGYDCDGNGVFNAADYAHDPRVKDLNGNGVIDPEDLIRTFSDGRDDDHNGYVDDIAGWDFEEDDNDPFDDVSYGHGTGEEEDSSGEAGLSDGQCPNCMVMMLRVGQSFVADMNRYAQAVVYAVDNRVAVVQEALGTVNHTSFGEAANDYAYARGVPIVASEADEEAAHHNWPAAAGHDMVVNSIRNDESPFNQTPGYLFVNGCTNFGGYTYVSIPSTSCSSEATGKASGLTGLLVSAAKNAVDRGEMTDYVRDDGSLAPYPLSAEEIYQLWRLAADDIDFSTPCPQHAGCDANPSGTPGADPPNNYALAFAPPSKRYQTEQGWDYFTGYGRANASRLLRFIGRDGDPTRTDGPTDLTAQDRIPPEADISAPLWWAQYPYKPDDTLLAPDDANDPGDIVVRGRVAANRVTRAGGSFDWVLEWAPGAQGQAWPAGIGQADADSGEQSAGPWTTVASGTGVTHAVVGELGRIPVAAIVAAQAGNPYPFIVDPTSPFEPERYAVRLRLRVVARPLNAKDTVNNEAVFQKQIDVYPAAESAIRDDLGVRGARGGTSGSPSFHDLNGDGRDELIVPSDDGLVHAYTDVATGAELPGWPVHTRPLALPKTGDNAYTAGALPNQWYDSILGGSVAVADLDGDGTEYVVAADLAGYVYAWAPDGALKRGFPVHVDFSITKQVPCGPTTIPDCDAYEPDGPKVDGYNRRFPGISFAPSVGKLDPNYPGLDIIAASGDGHVYAWHADGTPVPGWPVVLKDPSKVAGMASGTQFVTFKPDANPKQQGKVVVTPSLGDVDGDGKLEVVVGVNEEYTESPNATLTSGISLLQQTGVLSPGNTRLYALHHDGTLHSRNASDVNTDCARSPHTECQAYLKGWPVKMAMLVTELLPWVGDGTNAPAVLVDLNGDGKPEIADASVAGPVYLFNGDGSSYLGTDGNGNANTLAVTGGAAHDTPSYVAVGALAAGSLDGGGHVSIAGAEAGLTRVLDLALESQQLGAQDELALWDPRSGGYEPGTPVEVNDLQFFTQPTIADVTGDGRAEVIQGSAVNDTVVVGWVAGTAGAAAVSRYHSGGWTVSSAAVGAAPVGTEAPTALSIATTTREGYLRVYPTAVKIDGAHDCAALSQWPEYQHDAFNSGNYTTDATPPYPLRNVTAKALKGGQIQFTFTASGDNRDCGRADHYELRESAGGEGWNQATKVADFAVGVDAGQADGFTTDSQPPGVHRYLLRVFDKAGNGSPVAAAEVSIGGNGSPRGGAPGGSGGSGGGALPPSTLLGLLAVGLVRCRRRRARK